MKVYMCWSGVGCPEDNVIQKGRKYFVFEDTLYPADPDTELGVYDSVYLPNLEMVEGDATFDTLFDYVEDRPGLSFRVVRDEIDRARVEADYCSAESERLLGEARLGRARINYLETL